MTATNGSFLPDSLRPQPKTPPRSRRGFHLRLGLSLTAIAAVIWLAASWRLQAVSVRTCPGLPAAVAEDLVDLRGQWVPTVDLQWVRRQAEQWPGIADVDVELQLPGTLVVRAAEEEYCGSIPVGTGWRAVSCDGRPGRRLQGPSPPILEGFGADEVRLRRGLAVGRRFAGGHRGSVLSVREVTPLDLEVRLRSQPGAGDPVTVRVLPGGSPTEAWWLEKRTEGRAPLWADLRFDDRVVVGGLG